VLPLANALEAPMTRTTVRSLLAALLLCGLSACAPDGTLPDETTPDSPAVAG
jgi:type IV pilus biogenesis protein CpaD/CtpE